LFFTIKSIYTEKPLIFICFYQIIILILRGGENKKLQYIQKSMKKSILLVDDKPEIAKIIMLYLSSLYDVRYEENPIKAIAWLNEGNMPDGIISDLNMPEMNGEEFLCYLKANALFSHIPVLILSSVESSSNRIRLFEEGAEDFILKPFNPEELRVRVKRLLR